MDSDFLTSLEVKALDDETWEVLSDLIYQSALLREVVTVPRGFVTDFASVPRVPIIYTAFGDRAHHESVVHDFLYQTHKVNKSGIARAQADGVFREAMLVRGKSFFVREGMYLGVRLGGGAPWSTGPERYKVLNEG